MFPSIKFFSPYSIQIHIIKILHPNHLVHSWLCSYVACCEEILTVMVKLATPAEVKSQVTSTEFESTLRTSKAVIFISNNKIVSNTMGIGIGM